MDRQPQIVVPAPVLPRHQTPPVEPLDGEVVNHLIDGVLEAPIEDSMAFLDAHKRGSSAAIATDRHVPAVPLAPASPRSASTAPPTSPAPPAAASSSLLERAP